MALKSIKEFLLKEGQLIKQEQLDADKFHNRIQNEIAVNKKRMEEQRKQFRFIRNK